MIFATPVLEGEEEVIALIADLHTRVRRYVAEPRRWLGTLRRLTFARAVQGSNTIEGYVATLDDVVAAIDGEEPLDANAETRLALAGYRDAMTYVLQLARGPAFVVDESLVKALHFMMLKHDLTKNPGRWRPGAVFVRREVDGEIVYEGPDADIVPELMAEFLQWCATDEGPMLVRAAMAHLNLVMIHPFSDGNGRMARCLQTLVLAREQLLAPEFNSVEEYLGRNTQDYYDVLTAVGQGSWQPANDARPWLRFCLTAHYRQAKTLLRRVDESERLWDALAELVRRHRVPERSIGPLFDAAMGFRLRNPSYRSAATGATGDTLNEQAASRDLKALVREELLVATGEGRGRVYRAAPAVRQAWEEIRARRPRREDDDPFAVVATRAQPELPLR